MSAGLLSSIDQSTQLAGHNRMSLLLFHLHGNQVFGINVFKVQEVIPCPPVTPLAGADPLVAGVAPVRGKTIPIMDLARAIGQPSDGEEDRYVIVSEFNRTVQGFLVRSVDRIMNVDVAEVKPPPRESGGDSYLTAVTRYNDALVEIIDVERVLSDIVGEAPEVSEEVAGLAVGLDAVKHLKVLVADDSRVARGQIAKALEQLGLEAVLVNDGTEALRMLRSLAEQGPINSQLLMMISDVEMPDMDGYRLTTMVREDERLKSLYVLLHTSLSGVFNNALIERVGADRFVPKFDSDALAREVLARMRQAAEEIEALAT